MKKQRLYANAEIAEFWVVNLERSHIEVFREPRFDHYAETFIVTPGETVAPLTFPDLLVSVGDLLA